MSRNAAAPDADDVEGGATTKVHEEREATADSTAPMDPDEVAERAQRFRDDLTVFRVPIFTARPAGNGYHRPSRWPELTADFNAERIAEHRRGDALMGVMGGAVAVLDVDTKNGADVEQVRQMLDGIGVRIYAEVRTPSGGWHFYVAGHLDLPSVGASREREGLAGFPGVEILSHGHNAFLPGTFRASYGGAGYVIVRNDLATLADGGDDDSSEALLGWVTEHRVTKSEAFTPAPEWNGTPPNQRQMVYLSGVLASMRSEVGAIRKGGRNDALNRAAFKAGNYIAGAGLDQVRTVDTLLDAARANGLLQDDGERACRATILSGIRAGRRTPRAVPRPQDEQVVNTETGEVLSDPEAAPKTSDAKQTNAELVAARALTGYSLGVTPEGEPFAVECNGTGLAIPLGAKGDGLRGRLAAAIYDETGRVIGNEALGSGLGIVIAKAKASETVTPMHLRVAHDRNQIVLDLGQPNSARCVVITPEGWTVEDRPPAGILFRRTGTSRPLPTPARGGNLDVLRDLLGFVADDPRWMLVRGWLPASLRCNSPRPLLLMLGAAGSGKTSRGHLIVNVLDPRPELGSSFGRNLDDDRTKAFNSFQLGYDNLTSISEQTSDQVCRTVTGDAAEKRRNYTDTDVVVMPYRRTGVMTAINAPALRPDALERIIPISLSAMPKGARRSEEHLWSTFDDAHPGILGAVLDDAVTMLAGLPEVIERNDGPRMLDYWQSLLSIDPMLAQTYADNAADVLAIAAEDDPLVVTVRAWLRAFPRDEREGEPADEFASLDHFARGQTDGVPAWWPPTHRSMSAHLTKATNTLAAVGVTFERGKSNGRRTWRFVLDEEQGR